MKHITTFMRWFALRLILYMCQPTTVDTQLEALLQPVAGLLLVYDHY